MSAATLDPQQLRVALKEWEHDFFAANGHKPGRADIKGNREIAEKYKLYDKLTRKPSIPKDSRKSSLSSTSRPLSTSSSPTGSKRKRDSGVGMLSDDKDVGFRADDDDRTKMPRRKHSRSEKHDPNSLQTTSSDPYDPPLNEFFSPAAPQRMFIGPTPQKNGKVLGLFDLLSPESAKKTNSASGTPSRTRSTNALFNALTPSKSTNVNATPSKSRMGPPAMTPSRRVDANGNPLNGGVGILTPSRTRANAQLQLGQGSASRLQAKATPSTQRLVKLDLEETPEFLKRRRSPAFRPSTSTGAGDAADEDAGLAGAGASGTIDGTHVDGLMNIQWSPIAVRRPRKPIGRSFSEIVGANRRVEEQRIEDDLDILRELEREQMAGDSYNNGIGRARKTVAKIPKLQIQDSQAETASVPQPLGTDVSPEAFSAAASKTALDSLKFSATDVDDLPLGPDGLRQVDASDESDYDEEVARELARVGPRRYRKKGPKRQTRKFNIRPTQNKWQPEPEWKAGMSDDGDDRATKGKEAEGADDGVIVPETQFAQPPPLGDVPSDIEAEDDDYELASEYDDEEGGGTQLTAKKAAGRVDKKPATAAHQTGKATAKAKKPPAAKKVSATAHANYRSLKIKNKNSKGKRPGGRFGRRRG